MVLRYFIGLLLQNVNMERKTDLTRSRMQKVSLTITKGDCSDASKRSAVRVSSIYLDFSMAWGFQDG